MALYNQPALGSDAETEPEGENGANSMVIFLTSVPALRIRAGTLVRNITIELAPFSPSKSEDPCY